MTPREGGYVVTLLHSRTGLLSLVTLAGGSTLRVINVAWSRDIGAAFDQVSANVSPFVDGWPIQSFYASEVFEISDEEGAILFRASDQIHDY